LLIPDFVKKIKRKISTNPDEGSLPAALYSVPAELPIGEEFCRIFEGAEIKAEYAL
jgi:hypothetical protein